MKNKLGELEIGDEITDLIRAYKISLRNFGLELVFATPKYNRVRVTMDYFPNELDSDEVISRKINFVAMANDLANIIHGFDLPTERFGLTIFVNSKNFDILAKKNPTIAERDILGRKGKKGSKLIWYIQIMRLLDATKSNPGVT